MRTLSAAVALLLLAACELGEDASTSPPTPQTTASPTRETAPPHPAAARTPLSPQQTPGLTPDPELTPEATPTPAPSPEATLERPNWLGSRPLPSRPDGFGEVQGTPQELVDRRLPPPDTGDLPPPDGEAFAAAIQAVPPDVAGRSTWRPECPVDLGELRYVTVAFWGFDGQPHTGELLVHARAAEDLVAVFERLHEARFPLEEMRIVDAPELDVPPTGDGNNTTAFVCRPAVGQERWSDHAYGLAVDVNPFHNPYVRDDLVLPELASAYVDRDDQRPGMIQPGDVVTEAFADIGWGWGGDWQRTKDWMHFSASGR